ncbi:hypothetical protein I553_2546 [Mycobacterium xenopi 4042]|uniref:Uncharacterized protein n=1 Tax=Mycobacterium xenopi 4042 TaxID=1299334 RepID=X8C8F3_MYCXE|nr:hypothetical protein I553_2546 [Mycobacterium xenopi 4042]
MPADTDPPPLTALRPRASSSQGTAAGRRSRNGGTSGGAGGVHALREVCRAGQETQP